MIKKMINKIKGGFGMKDWSLKKKIMVGVAGIAAILGVFAYGKMNKEVQTEDEDFDNEDFDNEESAAENVGFESEETAE